MLSRVAASVSKTSWNWAKTDASTDAATAAGAAAILSSGRVGPGRAEHVVCQKKDDRYGEPPNDRSHERYFA
jgi:hypothetical protein